ncbi:MAG TPA: VOC family protein [Polyangia bacterium]|jgi:Predicted ring-cleavage extradiol dioxygenase|nr:VOC family protein [Polyangia bacterium]
MSSPTAVHHVAIKVRDLACAERFFVQTLGLAVLRRWPAPDGSGERSLWLDLGAGAFLALERSSTQREPLAADGPGLHLLALRIERAERQAWIDRLANAGVPLYDQTAFTIYCKDPEGNRIGLSHWPDPVQGEAE